MCLLSFRAKVTSMTRRHSFRKKAYHRTTWIHMLQQGGCALDFLLCTLYRVYYIQCSEPGVRLCIQCLEHTTESREWCINYTFYHGLATFTRLTFVVIHHAYIYRSLLEAHDGLFTDRSYVICHAYISSLWIEVCLWYIGFVLLFISSLLLSSHNNPYSFYGTFVFVTLF